MTSLEASWLRPLERRSPTSLTRQIQAQIRDAIRTGRARNGETMPSTRALAAALSVSRPIVVEAYAQLAAEGYLALHGGRAARVSGGAPAPSREKSVPAPGAGTAIRFDLRPAIPDLALFPRRDWLRAVRAALAHMTPEEFGYRERHGAAPLRAVIADYLLRVRGVVAEPDQIVITSGFAETRALFCRALATRGVHAVAVEDPSYSDWSSVETAGLKRIPIPVDAGGLDIARLERSRARALFVTPAHQFPVGAVLAANRRARLRRWLQSQSAFALEDDYDAEFRYDHAPVGALQGLAPDRVVYAGTTSKTLAPGLRLGWLVAPRPLLEPIHRAQRLWCEGVSRIDQRALAFLIESGAYDRHLRRMRRIYRQRRDLMAALLAEHAPDVKVEGVAAGLHMTLRLPHRLNEAELCKELAQLGVAVEGISGYAIRPLPEPMLLFGYGRASEAAIRAGVEALRKVLARRTRR